MKLYYVFFLLLILNSCSTTDPESTSKKQDSSFSVDLNIVYDTPGRGFMLLYPAAEMPDSLRSKITFPDLSSVSDTAYTTIYFTGKNHSALENEVLVLVGNYASASPQIWIDYNNDLNFSDTKPLNFSKENLDITLTQEKNKELAFAVRLHKADTAKKAEIKEMIDLYIAQGKKYLDFFLEERRNIKVGDFIYGKDSLRIGLMDWNVNGKFNDVGEDRIVFGTYKGNLKGTEEMDGALILDSVIFFQGGSYAFQVVETSAQGVSIKIKPTVTDKIKKLLKPGESISDFSFRLISGKETSLYKYIDGKKYVYLNFWASWCSGCRQEVEDLKKLHSEYSDKITIISLNYNESLDKTKSFLDKNNITWTNGLSSEKINEELIVRGLPRNILLDPSGNIMELDIHPSLLLNRMKAL